jgi:hypothetical protein
MPKDLSQLETQPVTSLDLPPSDPRRAGFLLGVLYCTLDDLKIDAEHLRKKIDTLCGQIRDEKLPNSHQPSFLDGKVTDGWDWRITEILGMVESRCPHRVERVKQWPKTAELMGRFLQALTKAREQIKKILKGGGAATELDDGLSAPPPTEATTGTQGQKSKRVKEALDQVLGVLTELACQLKDLETQAHDCLDEQIA